MTKKTCYAVYFGLEQISPIFESFDKAYNWANERYDIDDDRVSIDTVNPNDLYTDEEVRKTAKEDFLDAYECGQVKLIESTREIEYEDFTEEDKELYMETYNSLING